MQGPNLFRQEALQHQFTSAEELEKPFRLLRIGAWLPLAGLGVVCVAGLVWAILGRVPETVEGTGVLLNPGRVRSIETLAAGQIAEVRSKIGDRVQKDQIVAVLKMPELQQQLSQAQDKHKELQRTDKTQSELEDLRLKQEKVLRGYQEETLDASIQDLERLLARQEKEGDTAIQEQRRALKASLEETRKLNESLQSKVESARRLADSRVIAGDTLLQAESALTENKAQLNRLQVQLTELDLKDTEAKQNVVTQRGRLNDLRVQRRQLGVRATQLEQETTYNRATRRIQVQEQADRVEQLKETLKQQSEVRSPYNGRILEVAALPGQAVAQGTAVATLDLEVSPGQTDDPTGGLRNLAYFPVKTGKRIRPGMKVRVSPTTVQRERFGSIVGVVERVSEYAVTSRTAAAAVGNPELARALLAPGGVIEVEVTLERADTPTGFQWTSSGVDQPLTAGTTTRTTVTVEERAPITFLLPILRGWLEGTPSELPAGQSGQPGVAE